jgi:hypothetical protein
MKGALPPLHVPTLLALVAAKLAIHLPLLGRYGYFRDELYFLDCGRHLDWGYVDHAPLIGLVAKGALLLGASLPALRIFPALAGAGLVALSVLLARRLGGGPFAQLVAGLTVLLSPVQLLMSSVLSMNAFEPLFWTGAALALVRLVETGDGRWWLAFGALGGAGLLNKHSTIFFLVAVAAGVVLTPTRRWLATRWPWLGAGLAFLIFLPNLVWQWQRNFPTLEDLRNVARAGKNVVLGPVDFIVQQALLQNPLFVPVWLGGLFWLLFLREGSRRFLGAAFVVFFTLHFALHAKNYYLAPFYPILLAAGGVAWEEGLARWRATRGRAGPKRAVATAIATAGLVAAPTVLPLLSPEAHLAYGRAIGVVPPRTEVEHAGPLPQIWGDQFGWPELVADVAHVWDGLSPEERARAGIFANNYGEAGAINFFGPPYGLPPALSAHQTHYFWGPREFTGDVLVVLQASREDLERRCASVEEAGRHFHPWGMAEENRSIWVCRGLKTPLPELWPELKHWN